MKMGCFISLGHNERCDHTGKVLKEVFKKRGNRAPASAINREKLKYQTSIKEDNAQLDLSALGF